MNQARLVEELFEAPQVAVIGEVIAFPGLQARRHSDNTEALAALVFHQYQGIAGRELDVGMQPASLDKKLIAWYAPNPDLKVLKKSQHLLHVLDAPLNPGHIRHVGRPLQAIEEGLSYLGTLVQWLSGWPATVHGGIGNGRPACLAHSHGLEITAE